MKLFAIAFFLFLFTGCTTLQDAKNARGTGKSETYAQDYNVVWSAAVQVVDESNLDLISKDKEEGVILGQKGMSAFSYGENVAVFVDEKGEDQTSVEVVSKRVLKTNIVAKDWTNYILTKIREMFE